MASAYTEAWKPWDDRLANHVIAQRNWQLAFGAMAVGMQVVNSLETALMVACKPAPATVPWITSYFTPPTAMVTTVCTGTLSISDMLNYLGMAVFFALLCAGVPRMAAALIGGPLGHALEDLASVIYMSHIVTSPLASMAKGAGRTVGGAARDWIGGVGRHGGPSQASMQSFAADMAAQARARGATQATRNLPANNGGDNHDQSREA